MSLDLSRIESRIDQIESRINALSNAAAPTPPPTAASSGFAQAMQSAQPGWNAPAPETVTDPNGQTVRPLTAADLGIKTPAAPASIEPLIEQSAGKYSVPSDLVRAVIQTESGGDPRAVSRAGAMGLMQLMPSNVQEAGITDPFDPAQNIDAGTRQLAGFLSKYAGNLDDALAAYNAGPGAVSRYGGVPPYRETQDYVRKIRGLIGQ